MPQEFFSKSEYMSLAESAVVIHLELNDPTIESLLMFLDGEWVLAINTSHRKTSQQDAQEVRATLPGILAHAQDSTDRHN